MGDPIRKPLPESLMGAIRATCADPVLSPQQKFEATVLIAHGYGLWVAETTSVDPARFQIPAEQWTAVADHLKALTGGDAVAEVNGLLDWMNIGPGSYDPAEVTG